MHRPIHWLRIIFGAIVSVAFGSVWAQPEPLSSTTMADYTRAPLTSVEQATPQVMLTMTRDHQLYYAAYNDYSDLDGDGVIETTYKHDIDYYGYFDSYKCYDYDSGDKRFEPKGVTDDKYCDNGVPGAWSGNFLNWATTSRMDAVRRLLFGGYRSTDTDSTTILERAYIPMDGHAFVKYYNGTDFPKLTPMDSSDVTLNHSDARINGFTMCSMTWAPDNEFSDTTTRPPILRIAKRNFSLWNTSERDICNWTDDPGSDNGNNGNDPSISGIQAYSGSPKRSDRAIQVQGGDGDYVVRVQACVSGLIGEETCKEYPDGSVKPIGLLQRYGDDNLIHFGLLTGSYEKNISGGLVRKNIRSFNDEVAVDDNGAFKSTGTGSIVETLNALRMYGYEYNNRYYNDRDDCDFQLATIKEGDCASWGNPLSEMYLEVLRYYAGASATAAFSANDSGYLSSLKSESWVDPLNANNYCADLSTVVFNASVNDYDNDQMSGISDLGATTSASALTDVVAKAEGLLGKKVFIGRNGTTNDELCSAKTLTSLGDSAGICPEAPTKLGSYLMVGAAHYAATNDIRPSYPSSGPGKGTVQTVKTYGVALSPAVPKVEIPVPGDSTRQVTLLPAYRNLSDPNQPGGGSLVRFRIVEPHSESSGTGKGKFFVSWEDSEQGGDHDQDVWGLINYEIDANKIQITTETIFESTSTPQLFGYIISGTKNDGFHAHSGIQNVDFSDSVEWTDRNGSKGFGCTNCNPTVGLDNEKTGQWGPTTATFSLGATTAELLQPPLFYASKYGGFTETDASGGEGFGFPDKQIEWDQLDTDGGANPDGIPDNYFLVDNPAALEAALQSVFDKIISSTASGTAAAVVANAREGEGAVYQALFEPSRTDNDGREVRWIGTVHALWIDGDGNLREDDGDAVLESFTADPAVELFFDEKQGRVRFRRYKGDPDTVTPSIQEIGDLNTLWNAREQLSAVSAVTAQRIYSQPASTGRHIITFFDYDLDGLVDNNEQVDFVASNITNKNFRILNFRRNSSGTGVDAAQALVNYIRGEETNTSLSRNRTIDYDNDGTAEVMRLGDIVNSTPTVAAAPAEAFDLLYNDETYDTFRRQYAQRRNVIYVGANDGMLHAINGGCYDPQGQRFVTKGGGCKVEHPLGSELWAYVPFNLLPHLRWLGDPDYAHVPYLDGKPRIFDARIFTADSTHPNGWGTVLVAGFRFGGGELELPNNRNKNRYADFGSVDQIVTRSGYVVIDITDPEVPPTVLAEITHPSLGFATSFPTIVANSKTGNKSGNLATEDWYLVFGSGPTDVTRGTTNDTAKFFAYDLKSLKFVNNFAPYDLGDSNAFTGDPVTVDWDLDFKADAVYFGTVGGSEADPTGSLYKIGKDASGFKTPEVLLKSDEPIVATPSVTIDNQGNRYVLGGTGRFFGPQDKSSTDKQVLFGVLDADPLLLTGSESEPRLDVTKLIDVSSARVATTGVVEGVTDVNDYVTLQQKVADAKGWKLELAVGVSAERSVTQLSLLGDVVFATPFTPSADLCGGEGESRLYGLNFKTGTPSPDLPAFGTQVANFDGESLNEVIASVDLGAGLGASPSLHLGSGRDSRGLTVLTQTSTGAIERRRSLVSKSARSGEISWQETFVCN